MKRTASILAACLLAASGALYAQGAPAPADKGQGAERHRNHERHDGRHERHQKMKAAHQQARKTCEGKAGAEHATCMRKEMCAQSKDPGRCETLARNRSDAYNKAYDACKAKATGDEFRACMREQHPRARG